MSEIMPIKNKRAANSGGPLLEESMMEIVERLVCPGTCADTSQFSFVMAFQPIVDIQTRSVYSYEALVRGPNGEGAAHVLAGITEKNRYAFDQACRVKAISTAARLGLEKRLNINFLPNAVYHPEACLKLTLAAAEKYRFPANLITFEFTEDEQVIDRDHLKLIIQTYRKHNFMTALDDFGAGFAGLALLADFQPNCIKIDRCLVSGIQNNLARQAIVAGLIRTATMLGIFVVAEGVERPEEVAFLRAQGVRLFQGFLFAKPAIEKLIKAEDIHW
jgi:EAL domain-containing protein (putative c-di-GMP-specific phosphodiesterase class I)